jgi:hypothetical protein
MGFLLFGAAIVALVWAHRQLQLAEPILTWSARLRWVLTGTVFLVAALYAGLVILTSFLPEMLWIHTEVLEFVSLSTHASRAAVLVYFPAMLLGMAAEYMYRIRTFRDIEFKQFAIPFWVSLIVFAAPWEGIDKGSLTYAGVIASFQNGFFWKTILTPRRPIHKTIPHAKI